MNVISFLDLKENIFEILELSATLKKELKKGVNREDLNNKTLAMIFEKASTRTRASFEVGMTQLGGHAMYLGAEDMQLGRGESVRDTALALSRYVDGIMVRAYEHQDVEELAKYSTAPVINGLTDKEHPCQAAADLFTVYEKLGGFTGYKMAYMGDGNNVCNSLLLGCAIVGMDISVASPEGYGPGKEILETALKEAGKSGAKIEVIDDPEKAARGANIIYTDVWVSMGQENEKEKRMKIFQDYQVNSHLVSQGNNPLIMHCLPAKRGLEITSDVLDSPRSIVWDQAENRLHVQKAIMIKLMG